MKDVKLDTLTDRINYALEITKTKKADLARGVGVTPQVVQFLCNSKTQASRFTFEIATVLGINVRWLATGEGEIFPSDDPKQKLLDSYQLVPFIEMHQINKNMINEDFNTNQYEAFRAIYKTEKSHVFCSKILDSSMSPIIPSNAEIFIELIEKINLENNDIVLAYLENYNSLMIRKVEKNEGKLFLTPENVSLFKRIELNDEILILGKVFYCQHEL